MIPLGCRAAAARPASLLLLCWMSAAPGAPDCSWEQVTGVDRVPVATAGTKLKVAVFDSGAQLRDPALARDLFRNPDDPPGAVADGPDSGLGCPGRCRVDDDGDGFADRADPEIVELITRFEHACAAADPTPAVCRPRPDGGNARLDHLIGLDDDENGLPDDYHGYDFYAEARCLLDDARRTEPCRPEGPPNAHGTWVARAFIELGLSGRVELIIVRVTEGAHGQIPETDRSWRRAFEFALDHGVRLIVFAGGALNRGLCPRLTPLFEAHDPPLLVTAAGNLDVNLDDLDPAIGHWPGQCDYPATLLAGAATWGWGSESDRCPVRGYPGTLRGRAIDLMAPGSTAGGDFQQTSAAAAYLAAAAARLWLSDGFAHCSALDIRRALRRGSRPTGEIRAGTALAEGRFLDLAGARAFRCGPR